MLKKYLIVLGAVVFLIGASMSVSALSDPTNDIFHQIIDETSPLGITWVEFDGNKPDIDITDISYTTTDSQIIATMTVDGTISGDSNHIYGIWITVSGTNPANPYANSVTHFATLSNGIESVMDADLTNGGDSTDDVGTSTWTVVFDLYNSPDNLTDIWGYAYEWADITQTSSGEYWGDWAPDTAFFAYDDFYGEEPDEVTEEDPAEEPSEEEPVEEETPEEETNEEETDDTSSGTPGFEILTLIAAIGVAFIILRKRK